MRRRLVIRPEAEAELIEAAQWYERRQENLGVKFLLALDVVFDAIRVRPDSFPVVHGTVRRALAKQFPYSVYFLSESARVTVIAVRHTARLNRDVPDNRSN
jgi:toxin ParE1/3/4